MKRFFFLLLSLTPAFAQINDIATDDTGQILLLQTRFRLQTESDVTTQQKIYRLENGIWTRLEVHTPQNSGLVQSAIGNPFVTNRGGIYGWYFYPSHGLFPVVRPRRTAVIFGATLPEGFWDENLDISDNGKYIAGWGGCCGELAVPKIKATETGIVASLPLNAQYVNVGSDGTFAYVGASQVIVRGPGSQERSFPAPGVVSGMTMSDDGRWIALDSAPGSETTGRTLKIYSTSGDALGEIARTDSRGVLQWRLANSRVVFVDADQKRVISWDPLTRQASTVSSSDEPILALALSGNGTVLWTASDTNRLTRVDLQAGTKQEILAPLGFSQRVQGVVVSGSAALLQGKFTREQRVWVNGEKWPLSNINYQGYWFQTPWEWRGQGAGSTGLLLRNEGNPFENIADIGYDGTYRPFFPTMVETSDVVNTATLIAAHSDFRGVVSSADPARGGENIHIYATGMGALKSPVATGVPGPFDAVSTAQQFVCAGQFLDTLVRTDLLKVPAVVYAGGMIGIYQLELTLPANVPDGSWRINCWDGIREFSGILRTRP